MNYIIDGHNLVSKIPGLSLSMPDDEQRLIELLNRFGEDKQHKIEVYFDGAPPGQAGTRTYGRVRAHFVPASQTADEAIRRRLAKLGSSSANWVVVSSDRAVQAAGRERRAHVLGAEEFATLIQDTFEARLANTYNRTDQPISQAEVDEWLAIFNQRARKK